MTQDGKKLIDRVEDVENYFKEVGCCQYCCLRYTGKTNCKNYMELNLEENRTGEAEVENGSGCKLRKLNPCTACLGILQPSFISHLADTVSKKMLEEGYECKTFDLAVTLPVSYQIRSESLWFSSTEALSKECLSAAFPLGCVTVGPKDVLKWLLAPRLEAASALKFLSKADFIITLHIEYPDDCHESTGLRELFPEVFGRGSKRKRGGGGGGGGGGGHFSRKALDDQLKNVCPQDFSRVFPSPPPVPTRPALLTAVSLSHNSVYVAGRYCKYSRQLSQTPWIVGKDRKMESSVQEKITGPIQQLFKANGCKFGASGREDVDVRMLGRGRPFTVELLDPRTPAPPASALLSLERSINAADADVSVSLLQIVPKTALIDLKEGEETKCKVYSALCAVSTGYRERLESVQGMTPIVLEQRMPLRVLHRRPVALRNRTVHSVRITFPRSPQSPIKGTELVVVEMRTQAGTYVKEFIHGDLGRTLPSLRSITGAPFVDILALDVQDVELDWPPPQNV